MKKINNDLTYYLNKGFNESLSLDGDVAQAESYAREVVYKKYKGKKPLEIDTVEMKVYVILKKEERK